MAGQRHWVTTVELAKRTGVPLTTIHYYTAIGLLPVRRRIGNRRLYDSREAKTRLDGILRLRQGGYTLALIRKELAQVG